MLRRTGRISTSVKALLLAICLLVFDTLPSYAQSAKAATPAYAGWPNAVSAIGVAKEVFEKK